MSNYFKTTNALITDDERETYECVATGQNIDVLSCFKDFKGFGPAEIHGIYEKRFGAVPITSIRRAITTLTNRGDLTKMGLRTMGKYGRAEHTWRRTKI